MKATELQPTETLIGQLSAGLEPVRPLWPPVVRALLLLATVALVAAVLIGWLADMSVFRAHGRDARFALELAATLATGILAIVAAFHLAIPGRSERWAYAPLAPLAVWLASSGLGCLHNGLGHLDFNCLYFILMVSVPLGVLLFALLRVARPIEPLRVALMASLGVSGIAAFLLQFFHAFDVTVIDLAIHAVAIALIMGAAATIGRRTLMAATTPLSVP